MKKKYISPKVKTIKFEIEDIIQTSSVIITEAPKSFAGAEQIKSQEFSIFE